MPTTTHAKHLLSLIQASTTPAHLNQIHAHLTLTSLLSVPPLLSALLRLSPTLPLLRLLLRSGLRPSPLLFPSLLKPLLSPTLILPLLLKLSADRYLIVSNSLVHSFCRARDFAAARKVFDGSSSFRDLVSWNSLINGLARGGRADEGVGFFREMRKEGVGVDAVTMIGAVSCAAQLGDLGFGMECHEVVERECELTLPLANAIMDMYVKCGRFGPARKIFEGMERRSGASWTTMIVGCLKFGMFQDARKVFDGMPERDIFHWNAMITGFVKCRREKEAFELFKEMQSSSSVAPDEITVVSLLTGCGQIGALDVGMWLHHYARRRFALNVQLGTALVDMYAKCGNIGKSLQIFEEMPERNALTWTAVICGLATHGHAQEALAFFMRMLNVGLAPDEVTFIGVLSACAHGGLVKEGRELFHQMRSKYNLAPRLKHYSCMVDLLGRAGFLDEAESLVQNMHLKPDTTVLGALFFACKAHRNVVIGERVGYELIELDPQDSGNYVLLANIYEEAGMRERAGEVRRLMRERQVEKTPGCSSIEVDGVVHEFIVRDKSHSTSREIYGCLLWLAHHIRFGSTS